MPKKRFSLFHHQEQTGQPSGGMLSLGDIPTGSKALVCSLTGGRSHSTRLASLGLTSGVEVDVMQNYGRGPLILSVRGVRLAIGRSEAQKILVQKL